VVYATIPVGLAMETLCSHEIIIHAKENSSFNHVSQYYQKPDAVVLEENQGLLLNLLRENIGATLLLDLSVYDDEVDHPFIDTILRKGFQQRIIFITDQDDMPGLYRLFEKGARGFLPADISTDLLIKAIHAVENGEFWMGRKLTGYVMNKLILEKTGREEEIQGQPLKQCLTSRESEVAQCIAQGKCDKLIARDLNISTNTVKNHLRNIFTKLQISDRFQLALIYHGIKL